LRTILWAANAVVWSCVYIVDRNLKSEKKLEPTRRDGEIRVDLRGEPLKVVYQKKMIPEFTIYQV
ncbi:MAG: hypothetical protein WC423_09660, partial [Vulcanimicrobiota bacterium]